MTGVQTCALPIYIVVVLGVAVSVNAGLTLTVDTAELVHVPAPEITV